jgi:hypothetical protein
MTDGRHDQLIAYLATLGALVLIFVAALICSIISENLVGKLEVFGLGTLTGGLIGVLRMPQQRSVTVDNPPSDPVQTEEANS